MSEPRRWRDSPDAPVGVRELLGSATRSRPLDDKTLRQGARRLSPISIAPAAIAVTSAWAKLAVAGAVGLAAAAGVVYADATHRTPATEVAALPSVATQAEGAPPVPVDEAPPQAASAPAPAPEPAPTVATSVAPAAAAAPRAEPRATADPAPGVIDASAPEAPAVVVSTLSEELPLLEKARARMGRSPESALEPLAEHRARFPYGQLAAERDLMELDALRRTGRVNDARIRAHAWLARDPSGLHAARVRAILVTLE